MWYLFLKNVWHGHEFELETPVLYNIFEFIGETEKERERELYVKFMLGAIKIKE